MYWLHIILEVAPHLSDDAQPLLREAKELNLIFSAILRNAEKKAH